MEEVREVPHQSHKSPGAGSAASRVLKELKYEIAELSSFLSEVTNLCNRLEEQPWELQTRKSDFQKRQNGWPDVNYLR